MAHTTDRLSPDLNAANWNRRALGVGLASFIAGLGVMGGIWWLGVGQRQRVDVYWLTDAEENELYYVVQEKTVRAKDDEQAISNSLNVLIEGSRDPQLITAIPDDTRVLDVKTENDDIFINFSSEFAQGGGASSMLGRVTQVLYTATSQDVDAEVWISVEGKEISVLSGEGLLLDQPLTRASFSPSFRDMTVPAEIQSNAQ
ncbi:MAG: GerMN domain-containing protein [Cyanobacteria bacterium J06639_1]